MKAIETQYKGYRFRSRLEARWAVFFDALGLDWEYEPEGFDLGPAGWYLPDFRMRTPGGQNIWYEIKPSSVTSDPKFDAFEKACHSDGGDGGNWAFMLSGDPVDFIHLNDNAREIGVCPRCGAIGQPAYGYGDCFWEAGEPRGISFGCQVCDFETPGGGYHPKAPGIFGIMCSPHKGSIHASIEAYYILAGFTSRAAQKARSARFEHGERPA